MGLRAPFLLQAELAPFRLSNDKLKEIRAAFLDELQKVRGLASQTSSFLGPFLFV